MGVEFHEQSIRSLPLSQFLNKQAHEGKLEITLSFQAIENII
ncbi:hypothetical protein [Bacillus sp. FJAT-22090]|nr:hypothetical protein [Bacillus sp. FJAT-22090]